MADRTNATGQRPQSPAVLRPEQFLQHAHFEECPPSESVAPYVERLWSVTWTLPPGVSFVSSTVPHPSISLSVERGGGSRSGGGEGVWLTGVWTTRFDVTLTGSGGVFGVKFHPGAWTALTGIPASDLTDRVAPAASTMPVADGLADLPLSAHESRDALCAAVAEAIRQRPADQEANDERYAVARGVARAATDPAITRVQQLAAFAHVSVRALQRLTKDYIGVTPKWLIMRARVHDALAVLHTGGDNGSVEPLDELAARLGWFDQSHFIRDFRAIVGQSPAAYVEQLTRSAE